LYDADAEACLEVTYPGRRKSQLVSSLCPLDVGIWFGGVISMKNGLLGHSFSTILKSVSLSDFKRSGFPTSVKHLLSLSKTGDVITGNMSGARYLQLTLIKPYL